MGVSGTLLAALRTVPSIAVEHARVAPRLPEEKGTLRGLVLDLFSVYTPSILFIFLSLISFVYI
jgi:hypothetical protein